MTEKYVVPDDWLEMKSDGFVDLIGPLLRSKRFGDKWVYGLQTQEKHKNHLGFIHGGVLASLLDQVIAIAAWNAADRQPTVSVQLDTRFLGVANIGDFLEVSPSIRLAARSLIFVDAEVTCAAKMIACASAIIKISKQAGQKE